MQFSGFNLVFWPILLRFRYKVGTSFSNNVGLNARLKLRIFSWECVEVEILSRALTSNLSNSSSKV